MALSEKARSTIYTGLSSVIDQEAVAEMLSHFPARDVDEPVTKDHLTTQFALARSELHIELATLRTDLQDEIAQTRTVLTNEITQTRTDLTNEITQVRTDFERALREQLYWLIGTMITLFAICTTLILTLT